jgi:hypothetical protein
MIALSGAAAWQARLVDAGMTQEQATSAQATAQRAIFLAMAHPYLEPSFLDVVKQIPGWDESSRPGSPTRCWSWRSSPSAPR